MKNIYIFLILVILRASAVWAGNPVPPEAGRDKPARENTRAAGEAVRNYAFSVSPVFGFFWGRAEEIVYKKSGSDEYLSQLLWDFKPLLYTGAELEFGPGDPFTKSGFTASVSAVFGLPLRTGAMEDRDWMNADNDFLTHFSRHDVFSNGAFGAEFSAGYSWAFHSGIVLKVYGEAACMRFSWNAEDGYYQYSETGGSQEYAPWSPSLPKVDVYGPGLRYTQNFRYLAPGVSVSFRPVRYIGLNLSVVWTPLLEGVCVDDHLLRNERFNDYLTGGYFLKGMFDAAFLANERTTYHLSAGGRVIDTSQGDTYMTKTGSSANGMYTLSSNPGGAGLIVLDVSLSAKIQF